VGKKIDLVNQRFGRLSVSQKDHVGERGRTFWLCKCDCGNEIIVKANSLTSGKTVSCGCRRAETIEEFKTRFVKHGMRNTATYNAWRNMNTRCRNKNRAQYKDYGGRGIIVCERWKTFKNFYADMGDIPTGLSLDRKDNNGNYCKENCRWATRAEQRTNTRPVTKIEFNGLVKTLTEWGKEIGLKPNALQYRLKTWSVEKALTTPVRIKN